MTKQADQKIKSGWKPGDRKERDLSRLRELLLQEPLTFASRRRHYVSPGDAGACTRAAAAWFIENPSEAESPNQAITLAHRVYWDLWEERQ